MNPSADLPPVVRRGLHIGLTGGIGSGKSTVAALWAECGAVVFDADAVSRELTAPGGAAMPELIRVFGPEVAMADGALDRAHMRQRVFQDARERQRLEAVLHPMIAQRRQACVSQAGTRSVVFDIPLLTESPQGRNQMDVVVVVDCLESTQVLRVVQRSGLSAEAVQSIIQAQSSRARRRAMADAVIFNEGQTLEDLAQAVKALWQHWHAGQS